MDFQQIWDLIGERTQEIWTFISKHITEHFRDVLWYLNQFLFLIKNFPRFRRKPKDDILTWQGQPLIWKGQPLRWERQPESKR